MRNRLQLLLQVLLVLVASLLGIVTNYATNENDVPWLLQMLQRVAIPAIGLLIVTMVVVQVVVYRLENPAPPPTDWPRDRVPYPGLDAFVEDEAAVFFGREAQSEDLTRRLHVAQDRPADRFLVLVGASGSGKSSLVRAGVMPRLRGRRWSILPAFSPGPNPLASLASAISAADGEREPVSAVLRRLRQDPASLLAELSRLRGGRFRRMLVVVDQFEELVTLAGERERIQFLDALQACVTRDARIRILATLRVDFLGPLLATAHADLFQHPVAIGALDRSQLAQVVERPGALVGLSFAPGVVDAIVNDAGTDDALPLLAYLLQELYFAAAGPSETVTEELYRSLGGVAGALARQADHSIGQHALGAVEQQPEQALLLTLAALGECAPTPTARRGLMTALAFSHLRTQLDGHTDTVRHIAWSPDGLLLATASRDGTARVFDARSGRSVRVLPSEGVMVEGVAWSPDSARIATVGRDCVVRIWDAASGEPLRLLTGASDIGRQVAWSPDGRWIAGSSRDQTVRVWDADTGDLIHELRGHRDDVWGLAWAPDSMRLASASHDQTALVWDLATGTLVTTLSGHSDFVEGIAWSPDGRLIATGSGDHTVRIFDAESGAQRLLVRGHTDYVWNIAWSPDGQMLASASSDQSVRIIDAHDAKVIAVLRGHSDTVWGVTWSPDGDRLATSSTDGTGRIWDLRPRGAERLLLDGHRGPVNQAAWSHDNTRIATASDDGTVRVWDATTGALSNHVIEQADRVWSTAWSPVDNRLAISTNDGVFRLLLDNQAMAFDHRGPVVESVAWSPDGSRIATGDHDGTVRVWSAQAGVELTSLAGHQDWVSRIAWSSSGRFLASASDDRTCRLWDVAECRQLTVLRGHDNYVDDVAWSPDEDRIATASGDWTAAVWDTATGRRIEVLKGHDGRVRAVAWSPDGRLIATGSDDRTVRLWSSATLKEIAIVGVHQDKVASIAWSRDSSRLLTASFDGTARVWAAEPDFDRLEAEARGRVFRVLSDDERRHHMLTLSP